MAGGIKCLPFGLSSLNILPTFLIVSGEWPVVSNVGRLGHAFPNSLDMFLLFLESGRWYQMLAVVAIQLGCHAIGSCCFWRLPVGIKWYKMLAVRAIHLKFLQYVFTLVGELPLLLNVCRFVLSSLTFIRWLFIVSRELQVV